MPRRISDYADAFAGWNFVSSFGSIISVVATGLFLHIVYVQLRQGEAASKYPWLTPQFFSDLFQTLLNRTYSSIEWSLNSPPKPHAFVTLPLQSGLTEIFAFFAAMPDAPVQDYAHYCQSAATMITKDVSTIINNAQTMTNPENTLEQAKDYLRCANQLSEKAKSLQGMEDLNAKGAYNYCGFSMGEAKKDLTNIISNLTDKEKPSIPLAEREPLPEKGPLAERK